MPEVLFESNKLLSSIDLFGRTRLLPQVQQFELRRGRVLHEPGQPADRVYFPLSGLVAIFSGTVDGEIVQTGTIGYEGAIGVFEPLGSGQFLSHGLVQVPGAAIRLSGATFRGLLESSPPFRATIERYREMLLSETRQAIVCAALHPVQKRLVRFILDALERSGLKETLPLTQESLGQALGTQRTTVAAALSKLQQAGVIRNRRGAIEVLDGAALERLACSCRRTLQLARAEGSAESPGMAANAAKTYSRAS
ncbi:MAG TPA: Crp/Fnr family transcriptional regulator [Alphaproteobacteria bacterium]|nr:Crp/Fnr family transcriptional regulator [Alphaproteobacteria bacterium]